MLRVGHQENANEATYTAHPEDTRHPKSDTDSEPGGWGAPRAVPPGESTRSSHSGTRCDGSFSHHPAQQPRFQVFAQRSCKLSSTRNLHTGVCGGVLCDGHNLGATGCPSGGA